MFNFLNHILKTQWTSYSLRVLGGLLVFLLIALPTNGQSSITTDFSDGSWGEVLTERPASGEFNSYDVNGFTIRNGVLNTGSMNCVLGGKHTNRIALDKSSTRAYISLPELENIGELEIHASTGSDDKSFVVQEKLGRKWETIATYSTVKNRDSVYTLPVNRAITQLRIANNTGSTLFIWQIKTTVVSEEVIAEYESQRPIVTNFSDGTWGRPSSKKPESGEFPSFEANGFKINKGMLNSGSAACANDEKYSHSGRILLDKDKTGSSIEFPEIAMVGEVEIHAATGSDDRSFILQEYDGKRWQTVGTFSTSKKERVYTFSVYKESAKLRIANNTGSGLMIYQVKVFRTDAETIARQAKLTGLVTNFADGTWGEAVTERPNSGEYPTLDVNGFWIYSGVIYKASSTCPQGGKHYNRLVLDKDKEMARIDFPELTDVGELEIHASTGSDDMSFEVLQKIGRKWESLGIYNTKKEEQIYTIPIHQESARLRIRNNTSSSLNVYQIKMRTMTALNSLMLQASAPEEGELCYGNLTRKIYLQFSKEMVLGDKRLILNGDTIAENKVKTRGTIATIRVKMDAGNSHKAYTLNIPQGAFVSTLGVENEAANLSFKVHKTTTVPQGYKAERDAIYSNADIAQNRVDIYYPTTTETPVPVVINIHGGGWNHGEKESQTGFDFYFENGFAVANMEYRMTPQALAPAAVQDVRCLIHYLANNAKRLNIDPHKIILRGGSAGGHLALTAGYLGKTSPFDKCMFTDTDFTIAAVLDNYGPTDLLKFMHYKSLQEWLGENATDVEFVKSISPIHLIEEDTPPTYIIHGDADPTVEYEQSLMLEEALKSAGVKCFMRTVPGGKHGSFSQKYKDIMEADMKQFLVELNLITE